MKKIFFAVLAAIAITSQVSAQDSATLTISAAPQKPSVTAKELKNIVTISPTRLLFKGIRLKYERTLTPASTVGTFATYDAWNTIYPGFQIQPFWRWYFKKHAPEGFYFQPRAVIGYNTKETDNGSFNERTGEWVEDTKKEKFFNYGAGISLGYQVLFGKRNQWALDSNLGLKYVSDEPSNQDGDFESALWRTTAMGAFFDFHLSIGYRF